MDTSHAGSGSAWCGSGGRPRPSGVLLFVTVGELPEPYEQIFEGVTLLVAAAVVTWMLFWMRRQAAAVKGDLHAGWTA